MPGRVIGIGQPFAGDDGVGIAVARRIRECLGGVNSDVEVVEAAEPSAIVPLLIDGADPVVLVDAMVGEGNLGDVLALWLADHPPPRARLLSTHGIGVLEAVGLARILAPDAIARRIAIVGVVIKRPGRFSDRLSRKVAAAVDVAAQRALDLLGG